jgi:hypothetical protein
MQPSVKQRKDWSEFASLRSTAATRPEAQSVNPDDLVDMASYRKSSALNSFVAYAQDNMIFDDNGQPKAVDAATYARTPREQKLNKFGQAYQDNAKLWLHKDMADIVVDAALYMQQKHGWTSTLYDGLRTVNSAYNMYRNAEDSDLTSGLLAAPGLSAHNKGMAADLIMFDANGKIVPLGGNFDHLDMSANSRTNTSLPQDVIENRLKREIAFQHAALSRGRLFAPLRSEFWDERFPENEADHWRVLDSIARCMGKNMLSAEDDANRRAPKGSAERNAFYQKWELMNYAEFTQKWNDMFDEQELRKTLDIPAGIKLPPDRSTAIYHGDFNPLYDRDLIASGKNITDNALDLTLPQNNASVVSASR